MLELQAALAVLSVISTISTAGGTVALSGMTVLELIELAVKAVGAGESAAETAAKLMPAFEKVSADFKDSKILQDAAAYAQAWIASNQAKIIPGYAGDGSLTEISNPDLKGN